VNSNQFLSLLKKGNDLQKEDFQQLVKLHGSFPYFQIPAVLAAKYELQNGKQESSELLHAAAILSPNRSRLKYLVEEQIGFFDTDTATDMFVKTIEPASPEEGADIIGESTSEGIEAQKPQDLKEETSQANYSEEEDPQVPLITDKNDPVTDTEDDQTTTRLEETPVENPEKAKASDTPKVFTELKDQSEESDIQASAPIADHHEKNHKEEEKPHVVNSSHPTDDNLSRPDLITTPYGGDEATRPGLILPDKEGDSTKQEQKEEEKPILKPIQGPPSSRQHILKQLEDNLARFKSESEKNRPEEKPPEVRKPPITRRKRSGEDLIDSIKKKEKREIKDTKKKEQNDIIKAFNTKSIKLAAIKENEDVNKLQDLSLPSTKINDRMVSESYAKLLTQQGKKAAAKEIYKKLILKFPQKKAYFADLIQQLEE